MASLFVLLSKCILRYFQMASGKLTDKILYLRLKDKDKQAFVKAYDLYVDDIYRFIFFKVGSREEAEDISSGVFLKVWDYVQNNKLGEYNSLKPLLYRVARNAVIDYYRKQPDNAPASLDAGESKIDVPDEKQDMANSHDLHLDMDLVRAGLDQLKDEYREVIVLKYLNELDTAEIAKILDKSKGNVRVLLYRALSALRSILEKKQ